MKTATRVKPKKSLHHLTDVEMSTWCKEISKKFVEDTRSQGTTLWFVSSMPHSRKHTGDTLKNSSDNPFEYHGSTRTEANSIIWMCFVAVAVVVVFDLTPQEGNRWQRQASSIAGIDNDSTHDSVSLYCQRTIPWWYPTNPRTRSTVVSLHFSFSPK